MIIPYLRFPRNWWTVILLFSTGSRVSFFGLLNFIRRRWLPLPSAKERGVIVELSFWRYWQLNTKIQIFLRTFDSSKHLNLCSTRVFELPWKLELETVDVPAMSRKAKDTSCGRQHEVHRRSLSALYSRSSTLISELASSSTRNSKCSMFRAIFV